jgi:hypothetical protein
MTTAAPLSTRIESATTHRSIAGPGPTNATPEPEARLQDMIILESCHNTWIFDSVQMQFCRIVKGIKVAGRDVCTGWRPYWGLELDHQSEGFCVYLNPSRTRLVRSWRHTQDCHQCGGGSTTELSLRDEPPTVTACRAPGPSRIPTAISSHRIRGEPAKD